MSAFKGLMIKRIYCTPVKKSRDARLPSLQEGNSKIVKREAKVSLLLNDRITDAIPPDARELSGPIIKILYIKSPRLFWQYQAIAKISIQWIAKLIFLAMERIKPPACVKSEFTKERLSFNAVPIDTNVREAFG